MSSLRQILMTKYSCPPFLGMVLMTSLGLILLLEETILVPKSFSTSARRGIPADMTSSEIIYGKRISSIRKVEDFIIRRAPIPDASNENTEDLFEVDTVGNISFVSKNTIDQRAGLAKKKLTKNESMPPSPKNSYNTIILSNKGKRFNSSSKSEGMSEKSSLYNHQEMLHLKEKMIDKNNSALHLSDKAHFEIGSGKVNTNSNNVSRKNSTKNDYKVVHARHLGDSNSYFLIAGTHRSKLHDKIVKQFTLKQDEERDSFINLHRYGYVLDSNACDIGKPKFAILVHSKFNNFVKRAKIRSTYAKNKTVSGVEFAVVFVLGQPNIEEINLEGYKAGEESERRKDEGILREKERRFNLTLHNLQVENKIFKDVVMGNFTDSYRNLTTKHIMAYDWVLKRCKGLVFVLKVDDDILVNTYRVARLVKQKASKSFNGQGLLVCDVPESQNVMRGNQNKWFVSQEEYPFRFYPPWCKGYGVFMSTDVVRKFYRASSDVRNFWIDDVYVTGILAWRAGIQIRNFRRKQATVTHNKFEPHDIHAVFVWASFNRKHTHRAYWKAMVAAQEKM